MTNQIAKAPGHSSFVVPEKFLDEVRAGLSHQIERSRGAESVLLPLGEIAAQPSSYGGYLHRRSADEIRNPVEFGSYLPETTVLNGAAARTVVELLKDDIFAAGWTLAWLDVLNSKDGYHTRHRNHFKQDGRERLKGPYDQPYPGETFHPGRTQLWNARDNLPRLSEKRNVDFIVLNLATREDPHAAQRPSRSKEWKFSWTALNKKQPLALPKPEGSVSAPPQDPYLWVRGAIHALEPTSRKVAFALQGTERDADFDAAMGARNHVKLQAASAELGVFLDEVARQAGNPVPDEEKWRQLAPRLRGFANSLAAHGLSVSQREDAIEEQLWGRGQNWNDVFRPDQTGEVVRAHRLDRSSLSTFIEALRFLANAEDPLPQTKLANLVRAASQDMRVAPSHDPRPGLEFQGVAKRPQYLHMGEPSIFLSIRSCLRDAQV